MEILGDRCSVANSRSISRFEFEFGRRVGCRRVFEAKREDTHSSVSMVTQRPFQTMAARKTKAAVSTVLSRKRLSRYQETPRVRQLQARALFPESKEAKEISATLLDMER